MPLIAVNMPSLIVNFPPAATVTDFNVLSTPIVSSPLEATVTSQVVQVIEDALVSPEVTSTVLGSKKYVDIKYGISRYSNLNANTGELNWSGAAGSSIMRNNGGEYTKPGNSVNQTID